VLQQQHLLQRKQQLKQMKAQQQQQAQQQVQYKLLLQGQPQQLMQHWMHHDLQQQPLPGHLSAPDADLLASWQSAPAAMLVQPGWQVTSGGGIFGRSGPPAAGPPPPLPTLHQLRQATLDRQSVREHPFAGAAPVSEAVYPNPSFFAGVGPVAEVALQARAARSAVPLRQCRRIWQ
jgi:hypothetical protein